MINCKAFSFDRNDKLRRRVACFDVLLGNFTEVDNTVVVERGLERFTAIGDFTKVGPLGYIAHDVQIGQFNTIAAGCRIEGFCVIGNYNKFGSGVIVQKRIKIGNYCIFGSGTVVTKDIPDRAVVVGNPGRIIRYVVG